MNAEGLRPCPSCGNIAPMLLEHKTMWHRRESGRFRSERLGSSTWLVVRGLGECASGFKCWTKAKAIAAWNLWRSPIQRPSNLARLMPAIHFEEDVICYRLESDEDEGNKKPPELVSDGSFRGLTYLGQQDPPSWDNPPD